MASLGSSLGTGEFSRNLRDDPSPPLVPHPHLQSGCNCTTSPCPRPIGAVASSPVLCWLAPRGRPAGLCGLQGAGKCSCTLGAWHRCHSWEAGKSWCMVHAALRCTWCDAGCCVGNFLGLKSLCRSPDKPRGTRFFLWCHPQDGT